MIKNNRGFTLMELLVVIGILAILALIILLMLNPMTQIKKAYDGKRKTDLAKLKNVLEDYYNDHNCYPETDNWEEQLVPDYISELPTDPSSHESYEYSRDGCNIYRIYVSLAYDQDPIIAEVGCESGCGPGGGTSGGSCVYNYGICSSNTTLESCASCSLSCQRESGCNNLIKEKWNCPQWFCNNDECIEKCKDEDYWCTKIQ